VANPFTELRAPYPNHKVTTILPKPLFGDSRRSEATVTVKRTKTGGKFVYKDSSDRYTLTLPFRLTRMKSLELENFLRSYQSAHIHLTLYDGSTWDCQLVGQPVSRAAVSRYSDDPNTGKESVEVTLTFSAKRLT